MLVCVKKYILLLEKMSHTAVLHLKVFYSDCSYDSLIGNALTKEITPECIISMSMDWQFHNVIYRWQIKISKLQQGLVNRRSYKWPILKFQKYYIKANYHCVSYQKLSLVKGKVFGWNVFSPSIESIYELIKKKQFCDNRCVKSLSCL